MTELKLPDYKKISSRLYLSNMNAAEFESNIEVKFLMQLTRYTIQNDDELINYLKTTAFNVLHDKIELRSELEKTLFNTPTDLQKKIIGGDKEVIESIKEFLPIKTNDDSVDGMQIHIDYGYITDGYLSNKEEYVDEYNLLTPLLSNIELLQVELGREFSANIGMWEEKFPHIKELRRLVRNEVCDSKTMALTPYKGRYPDKKRIMGVLENVYGGLLVSSKVYELDDVTETWMENVLNDSYNDYLNELEDAGGLEGYGFEESDELGDERIPLVGLREGPNDGRTRKDH